MEYPKKYMESENKSTKKTICSNGSIRSNYQSLFDTFLLKTFEIHCCQKRLQIMTIFPVSNEWEAICVWDGWYETEWNKRMSGAWRREINGQGGVVTLLENAVTWKRCGALTSGATHQSDSSTAKTIITASGQIIVNSTAGTQHSHPNLACSGTNCSCKHPVDISRNCLFWLNMKFCAGLHFWYGSGFVALFFVNHVPTHATVGSRYTSKALRVVLEPHSRNRQQHFGRVPCPHP